MNNSFSVGTPMETLSLWWFWTVVYVGGQRTGGEGKVWPVEVCNKLFKSPTSWFQASTTGLYYTQGKYH